MGGQKVKIKICGLSRSLDIEYANLCRPDYIGFVFAKSRRQVTAEQAALLRKKLAAGIAAVGVFVNERTEVIAGLADRKVIDLIQLHGQEDEGYIRTLKSMTGCEIIQAFSVKTGADICRAQQSSADHILLDNGAGGTGEAFDWKKLAGQKRPFFLAGGLCVENIVEALSLNPYAVDVSSGAETDGYKDLFKMRACVGAVRNHCI